MMYSSTVITVIGAICGSSSVTVILTKLFDRKKSNEEVKKLSYEADGIHVKTEIEYMEYINKRLFEISENARLDSEKLTKRNDELTDQVGNLNDKLQQMMEWIIYDNNKYRTWLETELRKERPDVEFPKCAPPPKIFDKNNDNL